jgi:hypothetical protein
MTSPYGAPAPEDRVREAAIAGEFAAPLGQVGANGELIDGAAAPLAAEFLVRVLTGGGAGAPTAKALRLKDAHIAGTLDLEGRVLVCPIELTNCRVDGRVVLTRARVPTIQLIACTLSDELSAESMETDGDVRVRRLRAPHVHMMRARIGGHFELRGAKLGCTNEVALEASEITVAQSVDCGKDWSSGRPFEARGEVRLNQAHIKGHLFLRGAQLNLAPTHLPPDVKGTDEPRWALNAHGVRVDGNVNATDGLSATGGLHFGKARIGGHFDLTGAQLSVPAWSGSDVRPGRRWRAEPWALSGYALRVEGDLSAGHGFCATGGVHLGSAWIGGNLGLAGAKLSNANGRALSAYRLTVGGDLNCAKDDTSAAPFAATGEVHLDHARIGGQLILTGAQFAGPGKATADNRKQPWALNAYGVRVDGNLMANEGFTATGGMQLGLAMIGGNLNFTFATLSNASGLALSAYQLTVSGDLNCAADGESDLRFTATGEVRLVNAKIGGQLNLAGARLEAPTGRGEERWALNAYGVRIGGNLLANEGFRARGGLQLGSARVGGHLALDNAQLLAGGARWALNAHGLRVDDGFGATQRFTAIGGIHLGGAVIERNLNMTGARVSNRHGPALSAYQLTVTGDLNCAAQRSPVRRFRAIGEVRLVNAKIGGQLNLTDAQLEASTTPPTSDPAAKTEDPTWALNAYGLRVDGNLVAKAGFKATGGVELGATMIGRDLVLTGACLSNEHGPALRGYALRVERDARCQGLRATGEVSLLDATVDGRLDLTDAVLSHLVLARSQSATLILPGTTLPVDAPLDLTNARTGRLVDRWTPPPVNEQTSNDRTCPYKAELAGFEYQTLDFETPSEKAKAGAASECEAATADTGGENSAGDQAGSAQSTTDHDDAATLTGAVNNDTPRRTWRRRSDALDEIDKRIAWVKEADGGRYVPDAYDQLATVLRRSGHDEEARRVGLAKFRHRRTELNPPWPALNKVLDVIAGYGYLPGRTAGLFVALVLVSAIIYSTDAADVRSTKSSATPTPTATATAAGSARSAQPSAAPTSAATATVAGTQGAQESDDRFSPLLFALDAAIPAVSLSQENAYTVSSELKWWYAANVVLGWLLVPILLAAVAARLIRS